MTKLKKITKKRQEYLDTLQDACNKNYINQLSDDFILSVPCDIYHNCINDFYTEQIVDRVFEYYRNQGFPYYNMNDADILYEYNKFMKYDMSQLLINDTELNQIMHGLNITNGFFPNMWSVKCRNMLTPKEIFDSDDKFKLAIRKRIKMSDSPLKPYNIRKSIKIFSGAQSVSGFRPSIAKFLVEHLFKTNENISILDPCMGWGGRMFGFCVSDKTKQYVGFDVATETINGLNNLKIKMNNLGIFKNKDIDIIKMPFEDSESILKKYNAFDFIMTSPPYFNVEKYSTDSDQSFLRYNSYTKWVEGFLRPMIEISYNCLATDGYMALNVGSGKIYDETYAIMEDVFGEIYKVYNMRLSKLCGTGVNKLTTKFKHEPIIVCKK